MTEACPFTPEEEAEFEAAKPRLAKKQRNRWADKGEAAILAARSLSALPDHPDDVLATVTDTLDELMHFCREQNIEFTTCLRRAAYHYEAECDDNDDLLAAYLLEIMNEEEGL